MIYVYRDLDRDLRFYHRQIDIATQQGFLFLPRTGKRAVVEHIFWSVQHVSAAGIGNFSLCLVDSAGVPSPVGPSVTAIGPWVRIIPADAANPFAENKSIGGLEITIPEGFGVGWYCRNGQIGGAGPTYQTPTFMNIAVGGRWEGSGSRTAIDPLADAGLFAPIGSGV